jgi:NTP pyrophosphatase (non-canonical NTP hydrolase)
MTSPTKEQPAPLPGRTDKPAVWDLVISDMQERDRVGRGRYGTPLQPFNGRKPLIDLYQELLDAVVYCRQELYERTEEGTDLPVDLQTVVDSFRRAVGLPIGDYDQPAIPSDAEAALAVELIMEEAGELAVALAARDLVEVADALADLLVVTFGAASVFGLIMLPLFNEVHRTNMAKVGGPRRADGKLLKPPGWQKPRIAEVIERQRHRGGRR